MNNLIIKYKYLIRKIIKQKTGMYNPDLEQDVYIRLWEKQNLYTEQGKEKSWISVITNNICVDYFKNKFYIQEKTTVELPPYLSDEQNNPENQFSDKQRQQIILKAVNSLPHKLKQVIILQEFEDLSIDNIAQKLHIPTGTVKSRLFTAKQILEKKLYFLKPK